MYYVYLLTNKTKSVIYTGISDDLERRVYEHKTRFYPRSFTARYNVDLLVYYEEIQDREEALHREKQLKRYHRKWKNELIEDENPDWRDLSENWYDESELKKAKS